MSEKERRIAGVSVKMQINGEEYTLSPISYAQLGQLQQEALEWYKRQHLKTYADNADLLPDGQAMLRQELKKAAQWDIDHLPYKAEYDCSRVPIDGELDKFLMEYFDGLLEQEPSSINGEEINPAALELFRRQQESRKRVLLESCLTKGILDPKKVKQWTGHTPRTVKVQYDAWWLSGTTQGMVAAIHASLSKAHPKLTREEISQWGAADLAEGVSNIMSLTAPTVGNT